MCRLIECTGFGRLCWGLPDLLWVGAAALQPIRVYHIGVAQEQPRGAHGTPDLAPNTVAAAAVGVINKGQQLELIALQQQLGIEQVTAGSSQPGVARLRS